MDIDFSGGLPAGKHERIALTEAESKDIIAKYDVPTGKFKVAKSKEEAVAIFNELKSSSEMDDFAVVAKIDSRDVLHKSDVGGVVLKLKTEREVEQAYDKILANVKEKCPDASIAGVQICEMVPAGVVADRKSVV